MFKKIATISFIIAIIFVSIGFYKMYAYENPSTDDELSYLYEDDAVNAYVGGDAYNYIINAGKATANFTVAILFIIIGFGCLILEKLELSNQRSSGKEKDDDLELLN